MKTSTATAAGARWVRACGVAVLLAGCAGGDDNITSGFSGFGTNPGGTNPTAPATSNDATSEAASDGGSTMAVDPPTTGAMTTAPMTTTEPMTTEPMTTGPMTTDPSTTTTTGNTTNNTTTTTTGNTTDNTTTTTTTNGSSSSSTTDPPPPPPPKDPQPADGLYADCFNKACNMNLTDGCFELQDANMVKIDGYCTILCNTVADCTPKPTSPATNQCVDIGGGQKVCMLGCAGVIDCPTGMSCEAVNLNGQNANFCW